MAEENETNEISEMAAAVLAEQADEGQSKIGLKLQLLSISKDVLERNAALRWEQDKTKGLEVTVEEIIGESRKMLDFVLED
jgi:hypothetical protein